MTGDTKEESPCSSKRNLRVALVGSQKAPPSYKEGHNYEDWRRDIDLWNEFTSYHKTRRATAFLLELSEGSVNNHV